MAKKIAHIAAAQAAAILLSDMIRAQLATQAELKIQALLERVKPVD
jgi:hypothetical protein